MRLLGPTILFLSLVPCTALVACNSDDPEAARDAENDANRIRSETIAIARVEGCTASSQCAFKPMGKAICGGPAGYVVYCTATTDVPALETKLVELAAADEKANDAASKQGLSGACFIPNAPEVECVAGSCRETAK